MTGRNSSGASGHGADWQYGDDPYAQDAQYRDDAVTQPTLPVGFS